MPVRASRVMGLNLGLRLYLLLVAIIVPTLFFYYILTFREAESIHARQIETMVRRIAHRMDDWRMGYTSLHDLRDKDQDKLVRELKRIVQSTSGVESASLFFTADEKGLKFVAGFGPAHPSQPSEEDLRAAAEKLPRKVEVSRDRPEGGREKKRYSVFSMPLLRGEEVEGLLHIEVAPEELRLGSLVVDGGARTAAADMRAWLDGYREDLRERLARELRLLVEEPSGVQNVAVFLVGPDQGLDCVGAFGPSMSQRPTGEDVSAATERRPRRIELFRNEKKYLAISVPVLEDEEVRMVVRVEIAPEDVGLGQRLPELRANLFAGAAAVLFIVGVGVALFFQFVVRRPIAELTRAMEQATEGNLTAIVDAPGGEFGWLTSSYNQMIRQLKSSLEENHRLLTQIRGFNEDLQRKIAAATEELAAKNAQLQAAHERLFVLQRQMTTQEKLATLGQVAAIIAHELGSPLNAISGHIQMLLQDQVSEPRVVERLKVIDAQLDRLASIVRDVLKVMRVPPPRLDRIDLARVVQDVVDLIGPVAQQRGITMEVRIGHDLPRLQADSDQLEQVLMNLFTNAIDAMEKGGVLKVATAFLTGQELSSVAQENSIVLEAEGYVRVEVSDTGRGMDAEVMRHAFEPFHTTKKGDADGGGAGLGLGLGLAICRQIVRNHRGDIMVRSERGRGTSFTIYLPVEQPRSGVTHSATLS